MKYAGEARIFGNGRIVAKVRQAGEFEEDSHRETDMCDIWVDVFDSEAEARSFAAGYRKA